jgi:hypothetical protein
MPKVSNNVHCLFGISAGFGHPFGYVLTFYRLEEKCIRVPIRGTGTKVPVYLEVPRRNEKPTKIYIATVDLERLGKWAKSQRKKSRMQHLYVLGQIPHGWGQLDEETEISP